MESQREIDFGIQCFVWGGLALLGLIGVCCGAWWYLMPLMIGVGLLYSSWENYKSPEKESESQIDNQ